jgi:hypothetical protein
MSNKKTTGITLIAIYSAFSGLLILLGGAGILVVSSMPDLPVWITFLGLVSIVLGVFLLAAVYGLWTLQEWGRNMVIWLYIISIPLGIASIFPIYPGSEMTIGNTVLQLIDIGVAVLVIWYVSKQSVRALYEVE